MSNALLWDLEETAHQLGNVSSRTVLRMIARGEIATKKVGRRRMVVSRSVREWLDGEIEPAHTVEGVGRDVPNEESIACQEHARKPRLLSAGAVASLSAATLHSGGPRTQTLKAKEFADLLKRKTVKKRR